MPAEYELVFNIQTDVHFYDELTAPKNSSNTHENISKKKLNK